MKHASPWAAIAAIAPAAFGMDQASITTVSGTRMIGVHEVIDTVAAVVGGRVWAGVLKSANMTHEYLEVAGADHGNVITGVMPDIFAFLGRHSRPAAR